MKKNFDTDILINNVVTRFQLLSVTFIEYKQTRHLIDKAILGKVGGVYVTYVLTADNDM